MHTVRFVVNLANTFDVDYSTNLIDGLAQTKATTGEDVYFLSVFGGSSYADVSGCKSIAEISSVTPPHKSHPTGPKHDYPVEDNSEIHDKEKSLATSMQRKNAVQIREIAESRGVGGAYGTVCLACENFHITLLKQVMSYS